MCDPSCVMCLGLSGEVDCPQFCEQWCLDHAFPLATSPAACNGSVLAVPADPVCLGQPEATTS
jgi:hypothetical protein